MIIPFPHNSPLLKAAFEVLKGSREGLLVLAPLIVVSRALLNMMTMQGHAQHTKILTDTVLFFIGIYCLESLMTLIMSIPAYASEMIANKESVVLDKIPPTFSWFNFTLVIGDLIDYLTTLIFHLLSILYLLIMSIAIMLGGYVVFFATLFQVRKVFSLFIMICAFLSLWPFIWYALDRTFEHVLKVQNENGSSMGTVVSLLVLAFMKIAIPVLGFVASIKAPAGLASSVSHAARSGASSIGKAAKMGFNTAWAPAKAFGANEVISGATRPVANRVMGAMKTTSDTAKDVAPFAAFKTSKLLGFTNKSSTFESFSARNYPNSANERSVSRSTLRTATQPSANLAGGNRTSGDPARVQRPGQRNIPRRHYVEHGESRSPKQHPSNQTRRSSKISRSHVSELYNQPESNNENIYAKKYRDPNNGRNGFE